MNAISIISLDVHTERVKRKEFMKYLLIFLLILAGTLWGGDVFLLRVHYSDTWLVECKGLSAKELNTKKLVIGNEKFQIRQPLSAVKKIIVSEKFSFENRVPILNISFDDFRSFSLPAYYRYAMFSDLCIHPGVKNIWISNIDPDMKLNIRYLGNSGKLSGIIPLISISVWLEDEAAKKPESFYWQTRHDMLKMLPSPIKKGKNVSDFLDYSGVFYLHPFLKLELLDSKVQDELHKKQLETIQQELVWNILCYNSGQAGLEPVIDSYKKLLVFYRDFSSNKRLQKKIKEQLNSVKKISAEYNKRKYDAGIAP